MKTVMTFVLAAALCPIALAAAQMAPMGEKSANPVTDSVRQMLARDSKNLIGAAELMPADKYGYHPTPAQMTFGHLVMHVAQSNVGLCAAISGTPRADLGKLADTDAKDTLVTAIKTSFDYCTTALAKVTDAQLGDPVSMGRGQAPRAYLLVTIATDWADHYSAAASYLRLNGILPPSAQQPMGRMGRQ